MPPPPFHHPTRTVPSSPAGWRQRWAKHLGAPSCASDTVSTSGDEDGAMEWPYKSPCHESPFSEESTFSVRESEAAFTSRSELQGRREGPDQQVRHTCLIKRRNSALPPGSIINNNPLFIQLYKNMFHREVLISARSRGDCRGIAWRPCRKRAPARRFLASAISLPPPRELL